MEKEIEAFINDFVNDLAANNAAIFAGAGMSKAAGFVDWPELLADIAKELGLEIDKETDLISLAQYHVNEKDSRAKLSKKIVEEFVEDTELTENHHIIARLPVSTYWTTNYDRLIENALREAKKDPTLNMRSSKFLTRVPKETQWFIKCTATLTIQPKRL